MATSLKKMSEQVLRRLSAGDPSVASKVHPAEIKEAIMQMVNSKLRPQYFEKMSLGENIPEGCVIATYDDVPVTSWNGVSKITLPAIPVVLPKNMGVWRITPNPSTTSTGNAVLDITAPNAASEGDSGNTTFTFTVTRSGNTSIEATVSYQVVGSGDNPADADDFGGTLPSGTLTFASGETSKTITINVSGDTDVEEDETFIVILYNPGSQVTINTASATGTIENDEEAFAPTDIDDIWAWYKSDAGIGTDPNSSTTVWSWADQSGNGRNLAGISAKEPEIEEDVINGYPVIKSGLNASHETLMRTFGTDFPDVLLTGCTIFIVASQTITDDEDGLFLSGGDLNGFRQPVIARVGSTNTITGGSVSSSGNAPIYTMIDDHFYTIRLRDDMTNNYLSLNGAPEASLPREGSPGSYTSQNIYLFGKLSGVDSCNKKIAEVIIYLRNLSSSEVQQVETYLQTKYGHY